MVERFLPKLPRISLPAKLLLSYLLVISIGAIPTAVYLNARLHSELHGDASLRLGETARRMARSIAVLTPDERLVRIREYAQATPDRLTFIAPSGDVLFDSDAADPTALPNHLDRPEVELALGHPNVEQPSFDPHLKGNVGIALRVSTTTQKKMLYAAVRVASAKDETLGVLRLAMPVASIEATTSSLTRFARNTQAVAVSIAFGLSLLAAIAVVRPLQRVAAAAQAIGAGDLSAQAGGLGDDEVGDAGRALEAMAVNLRRRLASAGSGDAVLAQLVDALVVPCLVFEVGGDVLALNGQARMVLRVEGPQAGRRIKDLTSSESFRRAIAEAENDGEPEPIVVDIEGAEPVRGSVHVLKRPGVAPLYVFLGEKGSLRAGTLLPAPGTVHGRSVGDVVRQSVADIDGFLEQARVAVDIPQSMPAVLVAEAEGRLSGALSIVLRSCAETLSGRATLAVSMKVEDTTVNVSVDACPSNEAVDRIRPLIEPLGGELRLNGQEIVLWLPRA